MQLIALSCRRGASRFSAFDRRHRLLRCNGRACASELAVAALQAISFHKSEIGRKSASKFFFLSFSLQTTKISTSMRQKERSEATFSNFFRIYYIFISC